MGIKEEVLSQISFDIGDVNKIFINIILALILLAVGIIFGNLIELGLKKLSQKIDLTKYIRVGFVELALFLIKWSIYIIFFIWSLDLLGIPTVTKFFTNILITIPAFIGALILLIIGFAIGFYLREIARNTQIKGSEILSEVIFYFSFIIFGIFAIKTSLISLDNEVTHWVIIIVSAIVVLGVVYKFIKEK